MSKQWGHGFHKGNENGINKGIELGEAVGSMFIAEHVWHCTNAAIRAIENNAELEALGILRTLRYMLADATGHNVKNVDIEINKKTTP